MLAPALALVALAAAGSAQTPLEIRDARTGAVLDRVALGASGRWCLVWRHSVTGGPVADCFVQSPERLMLDHSFLHDHAAGLGEVPGRGTPRPAPGGGYVIDAIAEPLPQAHLPLRVGRDAVGHRVTLGGRDGAVVLDLSARHAGRSVHLGPPAHDRPAPAPPPATAP